MLFQRDLQRPFVYKTTHSYSIVQQPFGNQQTDNRILQNSEFTLLSLQKQVEGLQKICNEALQDLKEQSLETLKIQQAYNKLLDLLPTREIKILMNKLQELNSFQAKTQEKQLLKDTLASLQNQLSQREINNIENINQNIQCNKCPILTDKIIDQEKLINKLKIDLQLLQKETYKQVYSKDDSTTNNSFSIPSLVFGNQQSTLKEKILNSNVLSTRKCITPMKESYAGYQTIGIALTKKKTDEKLRISMEQNKIILQNSITQKKQTSLKEKQQSYTEKSSSINQLALKYDESRTITIGDQETEQRQIPLVVRAESQDYFNTKLSEGQQKVTLMLKSKNKKASYSTTPTNKSKI